MSDDEEPKIYYLNDFGPIKEKTWQESRAEDIKEALIITGVIIVGIASVVVMAVLASVQEQKDNAEWARKHFNKA